MGVRVGDEGPAYCRLRGGEAEVVLSTAAYVRPGQPRSGSAQELGRTTMGERSYVDGQCASNVRVSEGEGGKWTAWWSWWMAAEGVRLRIGRGDIGLCS